MYRDSFDTLARELDQLRKENARLRADWTTAQRLARPRRWSHAAQAIALVGLFGVACTTTVAHGNASAEVQSQRRTIEACRAEVQDLVNQRDKARQDADWERSRALEVQRACECSQLAKSLALCEAATFGLIRQDE